MNIIDGMLMELEHEAGTTRKMLERVPEEHFGWTPHKKSMTMGQLASHLAEIPSWVAPTLELDALELDADFKPFHASSKDEMLKRFDENLAAAKKAMPGYPDAKLFEDWALKMGGQEVFRVPRLQCLRAFVLSHLVHHRAQLGVYLRLKDVPLPSTYGPSADEQP